MDLESNLLLMGVSSSSSDEHVLLLFSRRMSIVSILFESDEKLSQLLWYEPVSVFLLTIYYI